MASPVEATIILADAAVADPSGKIHMLGAGWSRTTSPTPPFAVAVLMRIPWDRTNKQLSMRLELLDADGREVRVKTPDGEKTIYVEAKVEAGRPAGVAPGSMLDHPFVLSVSPLPLPPGRYQWRLTFAGGVFVADFAVA